SSDPLKLKSSPMTPRTPPSSALMTFNAAIRSSESTLCSQPLIQGNVYSGKERPDPRWHRSTQPRDAAIVWCTTRHLVDERERHSDGSSAGALRRAPRRFGQTCCRQSLLPPSRPASSASPGHQTPRPTVSGGIGPSGPSDSSGPFTSKGRYSPRSLAPVEK